MATLFWSPVRFFDARRHCAPAWLPALAAPTLCAALQGVSVAIFSGKTRPLLEAALGRVDLPLTGLPAGPLFAAMSVLVYPMVFGLLTLAVLALDVLVKDSGQPARLTEFTALSFYTQVPYCVLMVAIAWVWAPDPLRVPAGSSTMELLIQVQHYHTTMLSGPLLSTGRLLSYYSLFWLAAVLSIALKVVDRLSILATVAIAIVLFTVCAAGPIFGATMRLLP
jgi:hypothetical protein